MLRALHQGFGVEIDIRDRGQELVVSHDPPAGGKAFTFSEFLDLWITEVNSASTPGRLLAINIKSDGLAGDLARRIQLHHHEGLTFFCFDMSFPQQRLYALEGLPVAARISEYEPADRLPAQGWSPGDRVWLDCFESDWFLPSKQIRAICESSPVSVVSPEIHGRDPRFVWDWMGSIAESAREMSVCTDLPEELNKWLTS